MGYAKLQECVADLEKNGDLIRIDAEIDPDQEMGIIQRRAFAAKAPALLFTNARGTPFPMLANLFGTKERVNFIFRDTLNKVGKLFEIAADLKSFLKNPLQNLSSLTLLKNARPKYNNASRSSLTENASLATLPQLRSWPQDGGAFITLPLVYSEDPDTHKANLGMYRVQISGNDYSEWEAGLHYQIHRGLGVHHAKALAKKTPLPVNIHVGGPPALTVAAVMPLPEGISELLFAGILNGRPVRLERGKSLPVMADCDFVIQGELGPGLKAEGPFGDHMGYYSLRHDFPYIKVGAVRHRRDAIWPFTTVGRPPQEDTVFGDLIHELTAPLVGKVFSGVEAVHAVDCAGVHPLLLALGRDAYAPYEAMRKPRELLTLAMHLLGTTQTALAKYLLIGAREDAPGLNIRNAPEFLLHMLERTDFRRDLHFLAQFNNDTLDYTGSGLHEGSKLIWAARGPKRRSLGNELRNFPSLPASFGPVRLALPGIALIKAPGHHRPRGQTDPDMENKLCPYLREWPEKENFPLLVLVDDPDFCAASPENFFWTTFSASDPATDIYGFNGHYANHHWSCEAPLIIDARKKDFHAPALEEDPQIVKRVEQLASKGGPLATLF